MHKHHTTTRRRRGTALHVARRRRTLRKVRYTVNQRNRDLLSDAVGCNGMYLAFVAEDVRQHAESILAVTCQTVCDLFLSMGCKPKDDAAGWRPTCYFDYRRDRTRSRGGTYGGHFRDYYYAGGLHTPGAAVSFAMDRALEEATSGTFPEYPAFAQDTEIGAFKGSYDDVLRCLACHECCHAIQFNFKISAKVRQLEDAEVEATGVRRDERKHQSLWRTLYRIARKHFGLVTDAPKPVCCVCNAPLRSQSNRSTYCSARCRVRAHRQRQREHSKSSVTSGAPAAAESVVTTNVAS